METQYCIYNIHNKRIPFIVIGIITMGEITISKHQENHYINPISISEPELIAIFLNLN